MSNKDENEHISNTVSDENSDLTCQQRGEVDRELENIPEKQENQQATSSENQNLVYFPDYEIAICLRKPRQGKILSIRNFEPKMSKLLLQFGKVSAISI